MTWKRIGDLVAFSSVTAIFVTGPASWNLLVHVAELPSAEPQTVFARWHHETLGGTSVRLNLLVNDPDALADRAAAAGATVVAPVADQPYGLRQGRLADPFGHHWLVGRPLADGSVDWALPGGSEVSGP